MRRVNEVLNDLKKYAKETYGIQPYDISTAVLLITENECKFLTETYNKICADAKKEGKPIRTTKESITMSHHSEEFFPYSAMSFRINAKGLTTMILEKSWNIHLKEKYCIVIREEKILEYAHRIMNLKSDIPLTEKMWKTIGYVALLTHEFLHCVERELGISFYEGNEKDDELVARVMKKIGKWDTKKYTQSLSLA